MRAFFEAYGLAIYLVTLVGGVLLFSVWERKNPFVLGRVDDRGKRYVNHFLLLAINQGVGLLLAYVLALSALNALDKQAPLPLESLGLSGALVIGFLLVDLVEYTRHRIMHLGPLWQVHQTHHSDGGMDWSTELRFHPIEAIVTSLLRFSAILLFAIPAESLALYGLAALTVGLFQHANVVLPIGTERVLSKLIVTPSLHRVHHAADPACYNRNFAVIFIFWDHLFRSYRAPHNEHTFGVPGGAARFKGLRGLLLGPFQKPAPALG